MVASQYIEELIMSGKKQHVLCAIGILVLCAVSVRLGYAGELASDLSAHTRPAGQELLRHIQRLYCWTIFPVTGIVNMIALAATRDEKMIGILKKTLVWQCCVFLLVLSAGAITNAIYDFGKQSGGRGIGFTG